MMRKLLVAVAVWYFILFSGTSPLQVGPFATQAACDNFRTSLGNQTGGDAMSTCFSTTAKQ
jgi:hypothetical protein